MRRQLARMLVGRTVMLVEISWPRLFRSPGRARARRELRGRRVRAVARRGKHLLLALSGRSTLLIHLGMTGGFRLLRVRDKPPPHTTALFHLDNGRRLAYTDMRKFGRMRLVPTVALPSVPELAALGPEPLSPGFTPRCLAEALRSRRRAVKECLLDQRIVAGVGNIYASEALHRARVDPGLAARELTPPQVSALRREIRRVLREAIRWRGTTALTYADAHGNRGLYAERLRVYRREGEECRRCGAGIARETQGGRSTYFCPRCQGGLSGRRSRSSVD